MDTSGPHLIIDSGSIIGDANTAKFGSGPVSSEIKTSVLLHNTDAQIDRPTAPTSVLPATQPANTRRDLAKPKRRKFAIAIVIIATAIAAAVTAVVVNSYLSRKSSAAPIQSIAVMPFVNDSGNADVEYLADGMTETYVLFPNYSVALPVECMPKAKVAAVRAIELDDSLAEAHTALGIYLFIYSWNQPAAEKEFRRAIELNPNYEAIVEYRKSLALNDDPFVKALLARSLAKSGKRDEASKLLRELQSESSRRYVPSTALAVVFAALGEKDKAFEWLEKDLAERSPRAPLFSVNPVFDDFRDDPRLKDLLRRIELAKTD